MAGLVLIALIVILLFYIVLSKNSKKAFFISVAIVGVYMLYVRYTCGPDLRDVRVMKPMAEDIRDYIIKHGVPESLQDIPNLPYKLEGCKIEKYGFELKQKPIKTIFENCYFENNEKKYNVASQYAYNVKKNNGDIYIEIENSASKTGGAFTIGLGKNKRVISDDIGFYSRKTSGICNPMRQ